MKINLHENKNISDKAINELIHLLKIILKQNYFTFNNEFFTQNTGLAMGSPLSGILADIYLNDFENRYIFSNKNKLLKNIIHYTRYVDDTFLIFNGTTRQIDNLLNFINSHNKNIQFTLEQETNNTLNFLDLNITKDNNKLKYKIYRKPTTTTATINSKSYHPHSQKLAAYNSLIHRLLNVPMDIEDYNNEINIIKYIANSNGYSNALIDKLIYKHKKRINNRNKNNNNNNYNNKKYISAKFTNLLPKTLVSEFKKLNTNIGFSTNNNIQKILKNKNKKTNTEFLTGIYKLKCNDCNMIYIGQTGRPLKDRFKEHLPTKNNITNTQSNFAKHIIDNNHNYTNFKENLELMHYCTKSKYMDAIEKLEIYKEFNKNPNLILNDQKDFNANYLFDTLINVTSNNNIR